MNDIIKQLTQGLTTEERIVVIVPHQYGVRIERTTDRKTYDKAVTYAGWERRERELREVYLCDVDDVLREAYNEVYDDCHVFDVFDSREELLPWADSYRGHKAAEVRKAVRLWLV